MYISTIAYQNFRKFKDKSIKLKKGLNVFVGENNSGKTTIIDSIRYVLDTNYFVKVDENDFHIGETELSVTLKFEDLTDEEKATFLEYLSYEKTEEGNKIFFYLSLLSTFDKKNYRMYRKIKAGKEKDVDIDIEVRNLIYMAYFKPLRDAESELSPGRYSRLSSILQQIQVDDKEKDKENIERALITFHEEVKNQNIIKNSNNEVTKKIKGMLMYPEKNSMVTKIDLASEGDTDEIFRTISQKLGLDFNTGKSYSKQGLGYYNLLYMAVELILLKVQIDLSSFLLIEEPEAHLHPQLQHNLLKFIKSEIDENLNMQVFITTHSPNLASKVNVEDIILVNDDNAISMQKGMTNVSDEDYVFLSKFLDVTKSNMFFARGLIFVEGFSEEILVPFFASILGYNLEEFGVSVININNTGFNRFINLFTESKDDNLSARVDFPISCIRDLDAIYTGETSEKIDKNGKKYEMKNEFHLYEETDVDKYSTKIEEKKEELKNGLETQDYKIKVFCSKFRTLEVDLLNSMQKKIISILETMHSRTNFNISKEQIYLKISNNNDKSELAYRLSNYNKIEKEDIPEYIKNAILHAVGKGKNNGSK